jgi:hypothetical protein
MAYLLLCWIFVCHHIYNNMSLLSNIESVLSLLLSWVLPCDSSFLGCIFHCGWCYIDHGGDGLNLINPLVLWIWSHVSAKKSPAKAVCFQSHNVLSTKQGNKDSSRRNIKRKKLQGMFWHGAKRWLLYVQVWLSVPGGHRTPRTRIDVLDKVLPTLEHSRL